MNSAGISKYIYKFADTATGRLPGGLAQVNIFGSLIFAGMSGSALADIGGIGRIEIDAMREQRLQSGLCRSGDGVIGAGRADFPAQHSAHYLRHGDRRFGHPASARRHSARTSLRRDADADDRLACGTPEISARRALADDRRTLARLLAGFSGDHGARHSDLRNARRLLHPDRDRLGDGGLCLAHQRAVLPRIDLAGPDLRSVRDHPRLGRHPADCRGRRFVRMDPLGRAGAADTDRLDAVDLDQSGGASVSGQYPVADRRHVPGLDHRHPCGRADHRQAA